MDIRNTKQLRAFARERVAGCQSQARILIIYCAIGLGMAALIPVVNYLLGRQIDQFGGLRHMGTRSILSTVQLVLPIAMQIVTMCLDMGLMAAMLRVARGQYVSPQTLRLGFDRFGVLLRSQILRTLIFLGVLMTSIYLGILIFMVTPLSRGVMETLIPYLSDPAVMLMDESLYSQFLVQIIPAYALCGVLFAIVGLPMLYSYRMVNYLLIDNPAMGALEALRRSKQMMHRKRRYLLKLDLGLWPYYLAVLACHVLCYGDMILPMLGVKLPGHEDIWYFVFLALYLAALFCVYYFLRGNAETAYALAYDAVKPEEKKDNSVVLGNIFQM